jgi:rubrerythrin
MFTPEQYRDKANQYTELAKTAASRGERDEFQKLQRSFSVMADNEQWLADNHDQTVHPGAGKSALTENLGAEESHVLRCLGAAVIMHWNTLPKTLQRELFDNAGSMGSLADVGALRAQIARFLHAHKDDEAGTPDATPAARIAQIQSQ